MTYVSRNVHTLTRLLTYNQFRIRVKFLHETHLSLFLQFVVLKMEKQDGTGEFDSDTET